jgi:hypothetical protein
MPVGVTARRFRVVSPGAAVALGILVLAMLVLAVVFGALDHQLRASDLGTAGLCVTFGLMGVIVAWHQPRNPMGWVLLGVAFFFILNALAGSYAVLDYRLHHGTLPLGWLGVMLAPSWAPAVVLAGLSLLLFPDGRLPSSRWKPLLWAYLALGAAWLSGAFGIAANAIVRNQIRIDSGGTLTILDYPTKADAWWGVLQGVFFPAVGVCWVAWLTGQVLSYRRSSGERRLQLKWFLSGATVFIAAGIALVSSDNPTGIEETVSVLAAVGTFALPVSIGLGILKFRLYDIDRIISRTLAYAIVTGVPIGIYAGLVLLATQVLGASSPVSVAASTLVAAALFNPLRHRVQRAVDRRFNRAKYDADQMVAAFAARLQDAVDLPTIRGDLADVVDRALEPTHVSLWTRPAELRSL